MEPLYALSIRQPWPFAILSPALGAFRKPVENRSWRHRHRGPTLIHASAGVRQGDVEAFLAFVAERPALQAALDAAGGLDLDALKARSGGIVGRVNIVDCVTRHESPWFAGPFGFVMEDAEELPFLPCRGQLGFFRPSRPPAPPAPEAAIRDLFAA